MTIHTITDDGIALLNELDPKIREVQKWFDKRVSDRDLVHLSRICEGIYGEYGDGE